MLAAIPTVLLITLFGSAWVASKAIAPVEEIRHSNGFSVDLVVMKFFDAVPWERAFAISKEGQEARAFESVTSIRCLRSNGALKISLNTDRLIMPTSFEMSSVPKESSGIGR